MKLESRIFYKILKAPVKDKSDIRDIDNLQICLGHFNSDRNLFWIYFTEKVVQNFDQEPPVSSTIKGINGHRNIYTMSIMKD